MSSVVDWSFLGDMEDADDTSNLLDYTLRSIFDLAIPKAHSISGSRYSYPSWFNYETIACNRCKASPMLKQYRRHIATI